MRALSRGARTAALAAAVVGLGLAPRPTAAQTNGYVLQCFSARAAAQGCVMRGQDGIPGTLFRDPAGILGHERPVVGLDVAGFAPVLNFENAGNPTTRGARHVYPLPAVSYVGPRVGRLAWGVGVEPIGGFGADFTLLHPILSGSGGTGVDYESFFAAAKAGPVVAWEVAPGLGIGGSVSAVYARIDEFRMPFSMPPTAAAGLAPLAGLDPAYPALFGEFTELTAYGDSEDYTGVGWSADLGVSYRRPGFSVALSWSPETAIAVDGGTAQIDLSAQLEQMMRALVATRMAAYGESPSTAQATVVSQLTAAGLDLSAGVSGRYAAATEITLPSTVGLGLAVDVSPTWTVSGELEWRGWASAQETMPFELTDGDNANINLLMSADPTANGFVYPFPMQWQDTYTGKVGTAFTLRSGHTLRAGYFYGENPVPASTVFVTFPAISTQAVTFGGTLRLGRLPVDLSLVHALDQELSVSGGSLVAAEYAGSRTTLSETVLTIGTVWQF